MTNKNLKVAFIVAICAAPVAHAQSPAPSNLRPAYAYPQAPVSGIQIGDTPLYANPLLGLSAGRDTNLLLSSTNERATNFYILGPGVKVDARSPGMAFEGSYQGQFARFTSSREDDYNDHIARAQLDTAFASHAYLRVGYDYLRLHDPRGSTDRAASAEPDRYRVNVPNVLLAYGAPGAEGRIELYYTDYNRKYLNNRATTSVSDRDTQEYGGAFYWRAMPKTYLMAEARGTRIDYDSPQALFSGKERRYYVGAVWEATAATTGTIKVGHMKRDFDSGRPSASGASWEGTVTWSPLSYSVFNFTTSRQTSESTGAGNVIFSAVSGVTWNHGWTSDISSVVLASYKKDDFQGFGRTDKTTSLGFKLGYRFRKWMVLGAEYTYTHRDSNQPNLDYDKNLYLLTATLTM